MDSIISHFTYEGRPTSPLNITDQSVDYAAYRDQDHSSMTHYITRPEPSGRCDNLMNTDTMMQNSTATGTYTTKQSSTATYQKFR